MRASSPVSRLITHVLTVRVAVTPVPLQDAQATPTREVPRGTHQRLCKNHIIVVDLYGKILDAPLSVQFFFIFLQFLGKFGRIIG